MKDLLFGSHYFLNAYPLYVDALVFIFGYSLLLIGRWIFEGKAYNVAFSASWGGVALTGFIMIAASIIQQQNFIPANWMESKSFHFTLILITVFISIIFFFLLPPKQVMDKFYAFVMVPLFTYFILSTIPIVFSGGWVKMISGFSLLLLWMALVRYDDKHKRLNQRKWIRRNRLEWKFKN